MLSEKEALLSEGYDDARGVLGDLMGIADRARQAIDPRAHRLLLVWGLAYLVGFGALWADITFRDGRSPLIGFACLAAAGTTGLVSTMRELGRLRGLAGASQRMVRNSWTSWGFTVVAWWVLFGLHINFHPGQTVATTCATVAALAVVLTGAWLLVNSIQVLQGRVGMSLVIAGLVALQIPVGEHAMLFLWIASSLILLVGSVIAKWTPTRRPSASES